MLLFPSDFFKIDLSKSRTVGLIVVFTNCDDLSVSVSVAFRY